MNEAIVLITGWHLVKPQDFLLNNAFLGKGITASYSKMAEEHQNNGFQSPYQARNGQQAKEDLWEKVRLQVDPARPSRLGAFFLFESFEAATNAQQGWFEKEGRLLLRVQVPPPPNAIIHRADAAWLNLPEAEWPRAADSYWRGITTQTPLIELIVHGFVFFPDWEKPPFGLWMPNCPPLSQPPVP
jgi:hypothetical protein